MSELFSRFLESHDLDDFDLKDVAPSVPDLGHFECGEKCQICGHNYCTLIHRLSDRDWQRKRHLCQGCDLEQFNSMLDWL